jgi:hypothetical protein
MSVNFSSFNSRSPFFSHRTADRAFVQYGGGAAQIFPNLLADLL